MKSRFLALAACFVGACGVGNRATASALIDNLNAGKSQTVVLYGTSETQFGRWADTVPGHSGLSDWLASKYGNRATVINSGMSGKGSNTGVANLTTAVLNYHPDTVFIEFSMNDANTNYLTTDKDYNISLTQSRSNLNTMIDRIQAENPKTEIVLQTMNSVIDTGHYTNATYRPNLNAYYDIYRDVAKQRGLLLVDNYVNWEALHASNTALYESYLPDGLHPTAPGSLAITLPAIEAALTPEPATLMAGTALGLVALMRAPRRRR